jgi:hypothetical protein
LKSGAKIPLSKTGYTKLKTVLGMWSFQKDSNSRTCSIK